MPMYTYRMLLAFPKRAKTGLRAWRERGVSTVYEIKPPSSRLYNADRYRLMG